MKNRKKVSYLALRLSKNQKTGTEEMAQQGRGCTTLAEDLISVTAPLSDSSQLPSNSSSMGFSTFFWPPRALTQVHKPTFRHIYIYTDLKKKNPKLEGYLLVSFGFINNWMLTEEGVSKEKVNVSKQYGCQLNRCLLDTLHG